MKTRLRQIVEGRRPLVLIGIGYLGLAGLLAYGLIAWTKPEIEVMLTRLIPKLLWANFLLIAAAVVLCGRDIIAVIRGLFTAEKLEKLGTATDFDPAAAAVPEPRGYWGLTPIFRRPGVWLAAVVLIGLVLVTQVAPQVHRIYYDEDIYANMAQNIARTGQTGMANYGTFEYGEYQLHWLLYNKDPSGWSYLMSLVFQLFGTDEAYGFALNNLLFAGGIVIVFFIARLLVVGAFGALLAALLYALIPHNLLWANTISAENSAAVLGGLVVLCALIWLRTREPRHLFLLAAVAPFACAMRPESALIVLVPLAAAALNLYAGEHAAVKLGSGPIFIPGTAAADRLAPGNIRKKGTDLILTGDTPAAAALATHPHPFATRAFWALGLLAFALIIPLVWHFHAMGGQSWGASGPKFSAAHAAANVAINGPYYFNNKEFPILFTLLALAGLAVWIRRPATDPRRLDRRSAALLPLWFFLFWTIFLFFYAGSYKYGADVRFALTTFMPLAVLAGLGGAAVKDWGQTLFSGLAGNGGTALPTVALSGVASRRPPMAALLVLVLVLSWLRFMPLIRTVGQEAWGARHDHQYAREFIKEIPERAIVLTQVPTMFLVWGQNAIQAYAGINNPDIIRGLMARYDGHVYFHKSYWCNTASKADRAICEGIAQRYDLEPIVVAREQNHEYGLYRMSFKN